MGLMKLHRIEPLSPEMHAAIYNASHDDSKMFVDTYMTVTEYLKSAKAPLSRRKQVISFGYLYRMIRDYKDGKRTALPFEFQEIGKEIFIKK